MASDCESDNSYDSDDLCDEIEENEEIQTLLLCGLAVKGLLLTHKSKYVCRDRRSSSRTGSMFINEILNDHESRCYELFRLQVPVFNMLCRDLVAHYGLRKSHRVSIEVSLGLYWCHQWNTREGLCSDMTKSNTLDKRIALLKILWQHVISTCVLPLYGLDGRGLHMT
ncbi:unnamed protein product [Lactuca saligna]|uniref:DUF8040 domain-containing protein n=1 Tax=Lactuca saligna TaxID=75948 RepID=A0AA35Y8W9_LACSI|nr:unnamed protein product [Lactuca saligna]